MVYNVAEKKNPGTEEEAFSLAMNYAISDCHFYSSKVFV